MHNTYLLTNSLQKFFNVNDIIFPWRCRFLASRSLRKHLGLWRGKPLKWTGRIGLTHYWRIVRVMEVLEKKSKKGKRKVNTKTKQTRGSTLDRRKKVTRRVKMNLLKGTLNVFYRLQCCLHCNNSFHPSISRTILPTFSCN